jgi:hypothetical protein
MRLGHKRDRASMAGMGRAINSLRSCRLISRSFYSPSETCRRCVEQGWRKYPHTEAQERALRKYVQHRGWALDKIWPRTLGCGVDSSQNMRRARRLMGRALHQRHVKSVQWFSNTQGGSEPFTKFSTLLLFSTGYKSVDLTRSTWKRFVLIVQPLHFHYSLGACTRSSSS